MTVGTTHVYSVSSHLRDTHDDDDVHLSLSSLALRIYHTVRKITLDLYTPRNVWRRNNSVRTGIKVYKVYNTLFITYTNNRFIKCFKSIYLFFSGNIMNASLVTCRILHFFTLNSHLYRL